MKLYEFGKKNTTTIMCLPGNFMTHRQFENIVPLLENDYHVITVSFDGYDETGETVYTTAKEQAEKLTSFIKENLGGRIDLVYAESLGSVPAAWLTQMDISIGGVILSGVYELRHFQQACNCNVFSLYIQADEQNGYHRKCKVSEVPANQNGYYKRHLQAYAEAGLSEAYT